MIPLGPIALVGAMVLIPFAVNYHDNGIRREYAAEVGKQLAEQALEYRDNMQENADEAQVENEGLRAELLTNERNYLEKLNEMSRTIEIQMDNDPLRLDADIGKLFFNSLCKASSGRDLDARATCDLDTAQADLSAYSPILSINAEVIDNWRYLCEETGSDDYCKPHLIAIRPHGILELIGYIRQLDTVLQTQDANFDTVVDQINQILEMPGPEIQQ